MEHEFPSRTSLGTRNFLTGRTQRSCSIRISIFWRSLAIKRNGKQPLTICLDNFKLSDSIEFSFDFFTQSKARELGRFCGTSIPPLIRSSGNSLYVSLTSDEADTGKGFQATWQAVSNDVRKFNYQRGSLPVNLISISISHC